MVLGLKASEFDALCMVCFLRRLPSGVTNTVQFALAVDYIRYYYPFEVLQAKAKCLIGRAGASGPC